MTDQELLRYCGILGHTVVVISGHGDDRSGRYETCDLSRARQFAADLSADLNPVVYLRGKRGWRRDRSPLTVMGGTR
jgi:hypothetical protein